VSHAPFPELHSRVWLKALKVFQNALDLHQSLNDWLKRICCWKNSDLCNSTEVYLSHTPPTPLFKEKKKNQKPPASQESNASLGQTTDSECEEEETKPSTSHPGQNCKRRRIPSPTSSKPSPCSEHSSVTAKQRTKTTAQVSDSSDEGEEKIASKHHRPGMVPATHFSSRPKRSKPSSPTAPTSHNSVKAKETTSNTFSGSRRKRFKVFKSDV